MTDLSKIADRVAASLAHGKDGGELRDRVDVATGGDLDCTQLDIVTDMVAKRLAKPAAR